MKQSFPELIFWLAALRLPGIGITKFRRYLDKFPDIKELFLASEKELQQAGLTHKEIIQIKNPNWTLAENDLRWCEKSHCQIVTLHDDKYPVLLREIYAAPLVLFARGNVELLSKPQIALVGSRNATTMGCETANEFAAQLAGSGFVVTSGLAAGIDAASHRGALTTGTTIAVVGTGLKYIYPKSHRKLSEEIVTKGLLISEFIPDEPPKPTNFPRRNRIISGLSLGVLVVEATMQSGSLITARTALEQGREVFAIPGSIHNPMARGCHYLLRQGAKLVETANDILEELGALIETFIEILPTSHNEPSDSKLDEKQAYLLAQIGYEITSTDTIIVRSGLTASEVSSILLSLELAGYVQTAPGGYTRTTRKII
jgi:DNA processing protein